MPFFYKKSEIWGSSEPAMETPTLKEASPSVLNYATTCNTHNMSKRIVTIPGLGANLQTAHLLNSAARRSVQVDAEASVVRLCQGVADKLHGPLSDGPELELRLTLGDAAESGGQGVLVHGFVAVFEVPVVCSGKRKNGGYFDTSDGTGYKTGMSKTPSRSLFIFWNL